MESFPVVLRCGDMNVAVPIRLLIKESSVFTAMFSPPQLIRCFKVILIYDTELFIDICLIMFLPRSLLKKPKEQILFYQRCS